MNSYEPKQLRAGTTVQWAKSLSDYSAANGWSLKYKLVGSGGVASVTATGSGIDFTVTLDATSTASLTAGSYQLVGWVEKGSEKYEIGSTSVEVLANLVAASSASDTRSAWKKALDNVQAATISYSTRPVTSITIAGRSYDRPSLEDLYKMAKLCEREVAKEQRRQDAASGKTPSRIVGVFTTPL